MGTGWVLVFRNTEALDQGRAGLAGMHANFSRYLWNTVHIRHRDKTAIVKFFNILLIFLFLCFQLKFLQIAPLMLQDEKKHMWSVKRAVSHDLNKLTVAWLLPGAPSLASQTVKTAGNFLPGLVPNNLLNKTYSISYTQIGVFRQLVPKLALEWVKPRILWKNGSTITLNLPNTSGDIFNINNYSVYGNYNYTSMLVMLTLQTLYNKTVTKAYIPLYISFKVF